MRDNGTVNRTRLIDEPIVEMLLNKKYAKSGIKFMKSGSSDSDGTDIICYGNGTKRNLNIKRNSSKYYRSQNFSINVNKNKMGCYSGNTYVFIDEVADCLYIVDGMQLLNYILEHADNVKQSESNSNCYYIVIPKSDVALMVPDKNYGIIKYNKSVANLLAIGRDESQFTGLI